MKKLLLFFIILSISFFGYDILHTTTKQSKIAEELQEDAEEIKVSVEEINKLVQRNIYGEFEFVIEELLVKVIKLNQDNKIIIEVKLKEDNYEAKVELLMFARELKSILKPELYYIKNGTITIKNINDKSLDTKNTYHYYDSLVYGLKDEIKLYVEMYKIYDNLNEYYVKSYILPLLSKAQRLGNNEAVEILSLIYQNIKEGNKNEALMAEIKKYNELKNVYPELIMIDEVGLKTFFEHK